MSDDKDSTDSKVFSLSDIQAQRHNLSPEGCVRLKRALDHQRAMRDKAPADLSVNSVGGNLSDPPRCSHLAILINSHQRTVVCKDCNANVDPYRWIAQHLAEAWNRIVWLRQERERYNAEIAKLKEERDRLRANTRAARRRQTEAE